MCGCHRTAQVLCIWLHGFSEGPTGGGFSPHHDLWWLSATSNVIYRKFQLGTDCWGQTLVLYNTFVLSPVLRKDNGLNNNCHRIYKLDIFLNTLGNSEIAWQYFQYLFFLAWTQRHLWRVFPAMWGRRNVAKAGRQGALILALKNSSEILGHSFSLLILGILISSVSLVPFLPCKAQMW